MSFRLTKILFINLIFFVGFIFLLEIGYRITLYITDETSNKNYLKYQFQTFNISEKYALFDENLTLGYVPKPNFSGVIDKPDAGWKQVKVTIDSDGFRKSGDRYPNGSNILILGDSFAFGDQVDDGDTWASCLSAKLMANVSNAGVSAYGSAQALRRGVEILGKNKSPFKFVILSILVGENFKRDTYLVYGGWPRPSLEQNGGKIQFAAAPKAVKSINILRESSFLSYMYLHSVIFSKLVEFTSPSSIDQTKLFIENPNKLKKSEIMDWTFKNFSNLTVENKIILLLYNNDYEQDKIALDERSDLYELAKKYKDILLIDTVSMHELAPKEQIWSGHYTVFGNKLVCESLYRNLSKIENK